MTDYDRIMEAAEKNGWRPSGLPSAVSFRKTGKAVVTVRFTAGGSISDARIEGREVARSKSAAVIEHLRRA